ncbi:hypothetical protein EC988_008275 [Linderina pennispora]|nr:hypothetical protein EC988_008275 [Linderina pennispora]
MLAARVIGDAMEIDNDADNHQFTGLFEDHSEVPQTPGASLQLPPRAVAMNQTAEPAEPSIAGIRRANTARRHPALIRTADSQAGAPYDMRLVLQYELQHEDKLLKDLYAEVADQLRKLQTEERLLRMIVKKDFELPEEAVADDAAMFSMDPAYSSFLDTEHHAPTGGELEMHDGEESSDGEGSSSESDGSISGMSSSSSSSDSSDEEVQDEDIARASLGRILTDYVPTNGWPSTD